MKRRLLCLSLAILMMAALLPVGTMAAPAKVTVSQAQAKISALSSALDGKYFTVNQKPCIPGSYEHNHPANDNCANCLMSNVVKASWLAKALGGMVPTNANNPPAQYWTDGQKHDVNGWSCYGFANFAHWYIFSSSTSDSLVSTLVKTGTLSKSFLDSYALPGDVLRLGSSHSAIYISCNNNGFTVLDCNSNYGNSTGNCLVKQHEISWSAYKGYSCAITGVSNYDRNSWPAAKPDTTEQSDNTSASPATVTVSQACSKIDALANALCGKYFTVNQNACLPGSYEHNHPANDKCDNCLMSNVVKASWLKTAMGGMVPSNANNPPAQYWTDGQKHAVNGWACYGFANFAHWYIFAGKTTDSLVSTLVQNGTLSRSFLENYALPGDVLRIGSAHSAIYISCDDNGFYVLDCNWNQGTSAGNCLVARHLIPWSVYSGSDCAITGVSNYNRSSPKLQPSVTPEPQPSVTPTPQPSATPKPQPSATPEPQPSVTPEPTPSATPEVKIIFCDDQVTTYTATSAELCCNYANPGKVLITEKGFIIGTSPSNISRTLSKVCNESYPTACFAIFPDDLTPSTTYYLKAFVRADGKQYFGALETFTTMATDAKPQEPAPTQPTIPSENSDTVSGFYDVQDPGAYYYKPVQWAVSENITGGVTDNSFEPETMCTRAQVVTFLWRAMGRPNPSSSASRFDDVTDPSDYYYKACLWAAENGIANGTSTTTFSPDATVTRSQFVTFMWRAAGKPAASGGFGFYDVSDGAYYCTAVKWASGKGITSGTTAITFSPDTICSRGQVVTFLYRGTN